MTETKIETTLAPLRRAVKELEAAEDRAHASHACDVCRARTTMAVQVAREGIVVAARRLV
jgi:hypothetical protein